MIRRLVALIAACWLTASVAPALAHEGAEDITWVNLSGSQADGRATVQVDVVELADCDGLEPLRLEGVRSEREATGTLERVEPCRYAGEIVLPEDGRWLVTARFAYEDRQAEVGMPVGVTDIPQTFERGDWLHVVGEPESDWTTGRTLLLAIIGLAIGGVLTVGYLWFGPPSRAMSGGR